MRLYVYKIKDLIARFLHHRNRYFVTVSTTGQSKRGTLALNQLLIIKLNNRKYQYCGSSKTCQGTNSTNRDYDILFAYTKHACVILMPLDTIRSKYAPYGGPLTETK